MKLKKFFTLGLMMVSSLVYADRIREGIIVVQPKPGLHERAANTALSVHGVKLGKSLNKLGFYEVSVPSGREYEYVGKISNNKHFASAFVDKIAEVDYTPNDPNYPSQWHLPNIRAAEAWDIAEGQNVIIAIDDTGVNPVADLVSKLLVGYDAHNSVVGQSNDLCGHGTAVAGTAAATTNNAVGVSGIAGKAQILPIRIINNLDMTNGCYAYYSSMARGIIYAADNGARVVNTSFGGGGASADIQSAAKYMRSKGGVIVWSAGNSGNDPAYPDNPDIILVSAINSSNVRTSWSSFGAYVDITAPGESILTTSSDGSYRYVSGTSFSSPTVAGVAALVISANPALTPNQIDNILFSTAIDIGTIGEDIYYGAGRVDAKAAVDLALITPAADTIPPTNNLLNPISGQVVTGLVSVVSSASDNISVNKVELYVNNTLISADYLSPYEFLWDSSTVSNGQYTIKTVAYDDAFNTTQASVNVYVSNNDVYPPVVTSINLADGSIITANKPVKIISAATDDTGYVEQYLYINNSLKASTVGGTLQYTWQVNKLLKGTYTIRVDAKDSAGNISSKTIMVTRG